MACYGAGNRTVWLRAVRGYSISSTEFRSLTQFNAERHQY
jgi:hypothetical protein